jgi:hypothetical protein
VGKVRTGHSVSLDGCIAGPNDGPEAPMGDGGERLLAWYSGGDTEYRLPGTEMVFKVSPQTAELLRETRRTTGAEVPLCPGPGGVPYPGHGRDTTGLGAGRVPRQRLELKEKHSVVKHASQRYL